MHFSKKGEKNYIIFEGEFADAEDSYGNLIKRAGTSFRRKVNTIPLPLSPNSIKASFRCYFFQNMFFLLKFHVVILSVIRSRCVP